MPGFGDGPFGAVPLGDWAWGEAVFYTLLPAEHRRLDPDNGNMHLRWASVQSDFFDKFRHKIAAFDTLRDPMKVRTQYSEVTTLQLGPVRYPDRPIEQRDIDGVITPIQEFVSTKVHFTQQDAGKELVLSGSTIATNNTTVRIAVVVDNHTVITDPLLTPDAGALKWLIRKAPLQDETSLTLEVRRGSITEIMPSWELYDGSSRYRIVARRKFQRIDGARKALYDRAGFDGVLDALGRFSSDSALFTQDDVGKKIAIYRSDTAVEGILAEIQLVRSATQVDFSLAYIHGASGSDYNASICYAAKTTEVTITHSVPGPSTPLSLSVSGTDIVVVLETDVGGAVISTVEQVVQAIEASTAASEQIGRAHV